MRKKENTITEENFDVELENMTNQVRDFIKRIHTSSKYKHLRNIAAEQIIIESIIWGSDGYYEMIGLLEEVKNKQRDAYMEMIREDEVANQMMEDITLRTHAYIMQAGGGEA